MPRQKVIAIHDTEEAMLADPVEGKRKPYRILDGTDTVGFCKARSGNEALAAFARARLGLSATHRGPRARRPRQATQQARLAAAAELAERCKQSPDPAVQKMADELQKIMNGPPEAPAQPTVPPPLPAGS